MWSFAFSDGYECGYEKESHDEICFDIACQIRYHSWIWNGIEEPIFPDVYVYRDGELYETIPGKEIADEREIREYNKDREEHGLPTI